MTLVLKLNSASPPAITSVARERLLPALVAAARRSSRGQADVFAAMRHADIILTPDVTRAAVLWLQGEGLLDKIIDLSEFVIIVSVSANASLDPEVARVYSA